MPETRMEPSFVPSARLVAAFDYARQLHGKQPRKGTTIPYLSHLMAVAALVIEHGGTEEQTIAALLHDAIEDQNHDGSVPGEIERRFGPGVLALVNDCSDSDSPEKEPSWRIRKERYLEHLSHAHSDVPLISAADKLHNARAILADYRALGEDLWKRFNATREDELWYYRRLVAALRQADTKTQALILVDELEEVVTALERYAKDRDTSQ